MTPSVCCDSATVKKGHWSPEEDSILKAYIEQNGTGGNWMALPRKAGLNRCGSSCRSRWLKYLSPNLKHGRFSEEEERTIVSLYRKIGNRWSIIAAHLPGRTDMDIKTYWHSKRNKKKSLIRKDQHSRPPAASAAKQAEMFGKNRYVASETSTRTSVYGTQPRTGVDHNMNMNMNLNMNGPYHAHFSPGIVFQLFEQTNLGELPTFAGTNSSTQPPRFQLNLQQPFDQQVFEPDNNTSFRKLIDRLEATLTDRSSNVNLVNISQMQAPNWISINNSASQIPNSFLEYETTKLQNPANFQKPAVLDASFPLNDISLVFSPSTVTCGAPDNNSSPLALQHREEDN